MNNITFPLKPQMKGPDVANRQEGLRLLLERGAILRDDGARLEIAKALQREHEGLTFGDVTRKRVGISQQARRIEDSGTVDWTTADALTRSCASGGRSSDRMRGPL